MDRLRKSGPSYSTIFVMNASEGLKQAPANTRAGLLGSTAIARRPAIAAASLAAALSLAFWYFRLKGAPAAGITRFDIVQPNNVAFSDTLATAGSWLRTIECVQRYPSRIVRRPATPAN